MGETGSGTSGATEKEAKMVYFVKLMYGYDYGIFFVLILHGRGTEGGIFVEGFSIIQTAPVKGNQRYCFFANNFLYFR